MLMREVNSPPTILFIISIFAQSLLWPLGASCATITVLCNASGLSIIYIFFLSGTPTVLMFFFGTSLCFQPDSLLSNLVFNSSAEISPTTMSVEALGANQDCWNFTKSSRVMDATLCSVPEPEKGLLYEIGS